ncbi:MAG: hypothetical protein EOP51_23990, partial [Sphingobacteriales bacterium]
MKFISTNIMRTRNVFTAIKASFVLFLLLSTTVAKAQFATAAAYPFTASSKTFNYITGTAISFGNNDDGITGVAIGFAFPFCGGNYSTAYVSTNGFISFNASSGSNNFNSSSPGTSMLPAIMPIWDDCSANPSGSVTWELSGNAPDRVFTVQWKENQWYYNNNSPYKKSLSYQVKLYEQGVVECLYTPEADGITTVVSSPSATCAIWGSTNADFQSLPNFGTTPIPSTTTVTTTLSSLPAAGQSYLWGEIPCTGTPSADVVGTSPVCKNKNFGLSLTNVSIYSGLTYQWQKSTDNITWTNIAGATSRSYTDAINIPTYYRTLIKCDLSGQSYTTSSKFIDTANFYLCYCSTSTGAAGPTDIGNVRMISYPTGDIILDNGSALPLFSNPAANKGYTDYRRTLVPTPIYPDTQYRIIVSQISANATLPSSRAAVFIDYNRNGRFDPVERILSESTSITPPFPGMVTDTFKIVVPTDSLQWHGITGMRVILVAGATDPDTCAPYGDGRYTPCDGIPNAGAIEGDTSLCIGYDYFLTDSTYQKYRHGLSRIWEESADNVSWSEIPTSVDQDTIVRMFTGQPVYYRVKIRCSHTGDSSYSAVHKVNVKASYKCYCHSQSMGVTDSSDVGGFSVSDFSYNYGGSHLGNPRSWHKRQDFTDWKEIEMFVDSVYDFSVFHTQFNRTHGDAKITVFVDFNNNKQYDIPEERIYTG